MYFNFFLRCLLMFMADTLLFMVMQMIFIPKEIENALSFDIQTYVYFVYTSKAL